MLPARRSAASAALRRASADTCSLSSGSLVSSTSVQHDVHMPIGAENVEAGDAPLLWRAVLYFIHVLKY